MEKKGSVTIGPGYLLPLPLWSRRGGRDVFLKQSILSDAEQNTEGLKIVYDDLAPYAKENSTASITRPGLRPRIGLHPGPGLHPHGTIIEQEFPELKRDDISYPGYALCFPRFSLLNGKYINFPDNPLPYGYISPEVSNEQGLFGYVKQSQGLKPQIGLHPGMFLYPKSTTEKLIESPMLTVTFNQKFTSVGLLFTFNMMSGDYCTRMRVKWYADNNLLSDMEFFPDSVRYFCNNYVRGYNKLEITFLQTSKPIRPVFVTRIDYGIYRDFLDNELLERNCLQEINAISESISINTLNFTVRTTSNIPFDLQKKQKLTLYFNGELIGNFYLKNGARKNKTDYHMDAHDAVGVLDGNEFAGGIYTGQPVSEVLEKIFENEDFNYLLDESFSDIPLYGYIPYTTKRNALVYICFAIGAIADTSNYDGIVIYPQENVLNGEFLNDEVFSGVTLEHSDIVTGIRLTVHSYQKSNETQELYNDNLNGTAEVIFSEPYHSLEITGGTIGQYGDNYAYITGTGGNVTLTGKRYNHLTTSILKENPDIVFNKNIREVTDATLVYSGNAQQVLDRVYAYYQRAENVVGDVLVGTKKLGQKVKIDTDYDGYRTGIIESYNYSFSPNEIKAEVKIHE